jgi:hypothetical protein
MKKKKAATIEEMNDLIGCVGEFNAEDRMCTSFCALRLRCAIESKYSLQAEILEELMYSEMYSEKNQ